MNLRIFIFIAGYFLLQPLLQLHAQDVIITTAGDTIKCQIAKIDQDNIYFRSLKNGSVINTLIPLTEVVKYQHLYPGTSGIKNSSPTERKHPHFNFGVGGGYSYRLAQVPDNAGDLKGYLEKLKSGFNIQANTGYFFKKSIGIGLTYSFFRAKNYIDQMTFIVQNGHSYDTITGNMGDDIRINYIGPVLYFRFFNRNETILWLLDFSLGYTSYVDKGIFIGDDLKVSGSTLGMSVSFGADIFVTKNVALSLALALDLGTLSSVTLTYHGQTTKKTLSDENKENLAMINITAGIKFWK